MSHPVRHEILSTMAAHRQVLDQYNVSSLSVFGSLARGEEDEESDVDLLVELSRPIGFQFVRLQQALELLLNRPVDLAAPSSLKPQLRVGPRGKRFVPPMDWRVRIQDVIEASEAIEGFWKALISTPSAEIGRRSMPWSEILK